MFKLIVLGVGITVAHMHRSVAPAPSDLADGPMPSNEKYLGNLASSSYPASPGSFDTSLTQPAQLVVNKDFSRSFLEPSVLQADSGSPKAEPFAKSETPGVGPSMPPKTGVGKSNSTEDTDGSPSFYDYASMFFNSLTSQEGSGSPETGPSAKLETSSAKPSTPRSEDVRLNSTVGTGSGPADPEPSASKSAQPSGSVLRNSPGGSNSSSSVVKGLPSAGISQPNGKVAGQTEEDLDTECSEYFIVGVVEPPKEITDKRIVDSSKSRALETSDQGGKAKVPEPSGQDGKTKVPEPSGQEGKAKVPEPSGQDGKAKVPEPSEVFEKKGTPPPAGKNSSAPGITAPLTIVLMTLAAFFAIN